jgi:hypothetical protein
MDGHDKEHASNGTSAEGKDSESGDGLNGICKRGFGQNYELKYRGNTDAQPLSEKGPSAGDQELNGRVVAELFENDAYESPANNATREQALDAIEQAVSGWVKKVIEKTGVIAGDSQELCRVIPFGSYCLGVHSCDSDIDVLCIVPEHVSRYAFMEEVPGVLLAMPGVANVHCVPEAFVPVIKFELNGVDVDLGVARMPYESIPRDLDISDDEHLKHIPEPTDVTHIPPLHQALGAAPRRVLEHRRVPGRGRLGHHGRKSVPAVPEHDSRPAAREILLPLQKLEFHERRHDCAC